MHEDAQLIWTRCAIQLIEELSAADDPETRRTSIEMLRLLAGRDAMMPPADRSLLGQIGRARYGLTRWVDVWEATAALDERPVSEEVATASSDEVATRLDDFEEMAARDPSGADWREYLKVDELREATAEDYDWSDRRRLAVSVLDRLSSRRLSPAQQEFAESGALGELRDALRVWAAEPITADRLLAHVEAYEYSELPSDAALVADDLRSLRWAPPAGPRDALRRLETHYRNANARVAVCGELINRVVPQPGRLDAPVRDTVVNVPVRGHTSTFTELSIKLVPDAHRIRLGLEARGSVASNTISSSGPATFRNTGHSTFLVRKLFVLGHQGLHVWPAIAEAENDYNYLVSLETDFDGVPLVGSLVRTIAQNQHDEIRAEARRQTERKVAVRCSTNSTPKWRTAWSRRPKSCRPTRARRSSDWAWNLCPWLCRPRTSGSWREFGWPAACNWVLTRRGRGLRRIAGSACSFTNRH